MTQKQRTKKTLYNLSSITETDVPAPCLAFSEMNHYPFPFQIIDELYGVDFDGPHPSEEYDGPISSSETSSVEVPQTEMPITTEVRHQLRTINPLEESEVYGVDIYLEVLEILS